MLKQAFKILPMFGQLSASKPYPSKLIKYGIDFFITTVVCNILADKNYDYVGIILRISSLVTTKLKITAGNNFNVVGPTVLEIEVFVKKKTTKWRLAGKLCVLKHMSI